MNKIKMIILALTILIYSLGISTLAASSNELSLDARSYILMEKTTKEVLAEYNSDEAMPPASITKIMTIFLTYEALENKKISLDDDVITSAHAASRGGSQIFLEEGEIQKLRDMLKSVVVASANDAAVAISEHIAGSEEAFVKLMNEKAKELKMNNTHFVNACGLDSDGHVSSARDIAIISTELLNKYPDVLNYTKIWQDEIIHRTRRGDKPFTLTNTNRLVKMYPYATGLKTGSTNGAKYCLSGSAKKDDLELVAVVLGSSNYLNRFSETIKLLNYGFDNYKIEYLGYMKDPICDIKISKGIVDSTKVYAKEDISILKKKSDNSEIEKEIILDENIEAPIFAKQVVGKIKYVSNEKIIKECDLIIKENIEKSTFFETFSKTFKSIL